MKKKNLFLAATILSAVVTLALGVGTANAQIVYNSNPIPGWVTGTGNNSPNNTAVFNDGSVELALRAKERFQLPPTSVGNTYSFALGQDIGIDFSEYAASSANLVSVVLTVFDVGHNNAQSFNPALIPDNTLLGTGNGFQNSEALHFSFMDSFYNDLQNNSFEVMLTGGGNRSLLINVVQGTGASLGALGVPEPSSWALMILGFGGAGAALRRRRATATLAAA